MFDRNLYALFSQYLIRYPEKGEEGYDGIHDGGILGISEEAPDHAKDMYSSFLEISGSDKKTGYKKI